MQSSDSHQGPPQRQVLVLPPVAEGADLGRYSGRADCLLLRQVFAGHAQSAAEGNPRRPSDPRRTNPAPHHLQSILLSSPRGARRLLCSAPGAHRAHRARLQPLHLFHPSHPPNHLKLDPGSDPSLSYAHLNAQTSSSALLFARHRTGALSDSVGNPPKALRRHFSSFL